MKGGYKQRSIVITPAGLVFLLSDHVTKCKICKRSKLRKMCAAGNNLRLDLERSMERFGTRRPATVLVPDPEYPSITFSPQCRHERTSHDINQCPECRRHSGLTG